METPFEQAPFGNTVALDDLLLPVGHPLRNALMESLLAHGYEFCEPLPNLQTPLDILEVVEDLAPGPQRDEWIQLRGALRQAVRSGTLVDLGLYPA